MFYTRLSLSSPPSLSLFLSLDPSLDRVTSVLFHRSLVLGDLLGLPSRGEDVAVNVFGINPPSVPTPFSSVLVSVSVFMALSTVFHSINFPDNSPISHPVLLPYWSLQLYIS